MTVRSVRGVPYAYEGRGGLPLFEDMAAADVCAPRARKGRRGRFRWRPHPKSSPSSRTAAPKPFPKKCRPHSADRGRLAPHHFPPLISTLTAVIVTAARNSITAALSAAFMAWLGWLSLRRVASG